MADLREFESYSVRVHRRQFIWQILVPFLLVTVLVVVGAVLIALGGPVLTDPWRDVSIIWLVFPMLFLALVLLIVLGVLVYALSRIKKATPRVTAKVQHFFMRVNAGSRTVADKTVQPVLWSKQASAVVGRFFAYINPKNRQVR